MRLRRRNGDLRLGLLTTLQATGMWFFGLYNSPAALVTTLTLAAIVNGIAMGFERGMRTPWQLVVNYATCAPTLTSMGSPANGTATTKEAELVSKAGGFHVRGLFSMRDR